MQDTAGEVGASSLVMYSYGSLHMTIAQSAGAVEYTDCTSAEG